MKKIIGLHIVFIIISACYTAEYLAVFNNLPQKSRNEYSIFRQIGTDYLAIIDDTQLHQLQKARDCSFSILDTNPRTNMYYLLGNSRQWEPTILRYGMILKRYEAFLLFKTVSQYSDSLRSLPLRRELLDFSPLQFDDESNIRFAPSGTKDPLIVKMLSEVSIDTMENLVRKLQSFSSRHYSTTENKSVVCPWLRTLLSQWCDSAYLESVNSSCGPNVVGVKKGSKNPSSTNYCVVGGHMDAVTTSGPFKAAGADDNATGTAAVLECARVFKKYSFENTIKFVLFNGEEGGMIGSKAFVNNMKNAKHTLIGGAVTFDMLGHSSASSKNLVQLEGFNNNSANSKFVTEFMKGVVQQYTSLDTYEYLEGFGSDHVSFNTQGYVSMLCIEKEYENPANHTNYDTLGCPTGLNDMELFDNISKAGIAAIAVLAKPYNETSNSVDKININALSSIAIIQPNSRLVQIRISVNSLEPTSIHIYSAQGRLIQTFSNTQSLSQLFTWDCSDKGKYFSGTYFIRVSIGTHAVIRKIIIL
ncbi:M20/M25/M40 family metallo-hydrolase [bacterium]|nr:M20/M25/M40 family metallo-hydrolase [candidate division CSSED10-310 bacterium]